MPPRVFTVAVTVGMVCLALPALGADRLGSSEEQRVGGQKFGLHHPRVDEDQTVAGCRRRVAVESFDRVGFLHREKLEIPQNLPGLTIDSDGIEMPAIGPAIGRGNHGCIPVRPGGPDLLVGSRATRLYAVSGQGKLLWTFPTADELSSPPAVADLDQDGYSEVVVASRDGCLYVLGAGPASPGVQQSLQYRAGSARTGHMSAGEVLLPRSC